MSVLDSVLQEELAEVKKQIGRRKKLEESIKELKANMKKIKRVTK